MMAMMHRYPSIAINLLGIVLRRIDDMQQRYLEICTEHVDQRIARSLLRIMRRAGLKTPDGVTLLDRYPRLLPSFMKLGLLYVGCPAEAFHTLEDVAREYHLDLDQLLQRFDMVIGDKEAPENCPPTKRRVE